MHCSEHVPVLQLDIQGTPQAWISLEQAALHVASDAVAWVEGIGPLATLRGGFNLARARQSTIDVHPIIALHGAAKVNRFDVPPVLGKAKLFRRDRMTCAYCGGRFAERELQCEHIVPESRGGKATWMNLVAACGPATAARPTARPRRHACRSSICRTCRAASRTSSSRAEPSVPTCTSGSPHACRRDRA